MSDTFRKPWEKTMAFGGVATGSMKAKDALRVQGIITYRGFRLMDWDCEDTDTDVMLSPQRKKSEVCGRVTMDARIGRNSVAVATLLAHSVKTVMRRQRTMVMAQGGMEWSGVI